MEVQVGKLTVRTAQRGAARDAGFRVRSESLLRSLDYNPRACPDARSSSCAGWSWLRSTAPPPSGPGPPSPTSGGRQPRPVTGPVEASAGPCFSAMKSNCSHASPPTSTRHGSRPMVLAGDHPGRLRRRRRARCGAGRRLDLAGALAPGPSPGSPSRRPKGPYPCSPPRNLAGPAGPAGRVRSR